MQRPSPDPRAGRRTAARDDEHGYGPNPRSQRFRESHARRADVPLGATWPPAAIPDRFFGEANGGYAYRYYGGEAEAPPYSGGRAYGLDLGEADGFYSFSRARRAQRQGPKGYVRTDERIREDICERLAVREDIDVSDVSVSVSVSAGCVTLEGTVPERGMKHRIEDLCDDSGGVREIDNRIKVSLPAADAPRRT